MRRQIACIVVVLCAWLSLPAKAIDCSSPTLKAASGVIGNKHSYKVAGDCVYAWSETESEVFSSTTTNKSLSFSYVGGATWDRLSGEAEEQLKLTGDSVGSRVATATCSQDPFLKDPPGGVAKCGPVTVQAEVESGGTYALLIKKEFWVSSRLSLAEAQALSALPPPSQPQAPASDPPPQVPSVSSTSTPTPMVSGAVAASVPTGAGAVTAGPGPQTVSGVVTPGPLSTPAARAGADSRQVAPPAAERQRVATPPARIATLLEIEAESLVASGAIEVSGGQAVAQPMTGFGDGWSGGAQLFWTGGTVGAVLDILIDVPAASKYAVEIYMTRAPDYGRLQLEVDGKASSVPFDGIAPQVFPSGPIQVGTFPLQAGNRRVSLMITGKHPQSTGYYVGIDKVRLYPAGPIN